MRSERDAARRHEDDAITLLRGLGTRPLRAHALAERAGRTGDPGALRKAQEIFSELGASRWLGRLNEAAGAQVQAQAQATSRSF